MCLSPVKIGYRPGDYSISDEHQMVACRTCRICRDNRVNDLIGRCIAEQCTASKAFSVTLTYRGDGPETAILRYSDVQLFLKRLRKDGYTVRYICAGEYGTKKGRAHWHIILFFYGRSPQVELEARVDWKYWTHGFSYFQTVDYKGFRYALKYAIKDQTDPGAAKALSMSKKPPLGYDYFMEMADEMAQRKFALWKPEYEFMHGDKKRIYWLQGRMREVFLERYCKEWKKLHGGDPPYTDWLYERYLDPLAKKEMENDPLSFDRDRDQRLARYDAAQAAKRAAEYEEKRHALGMMLIDRDKRHWAVVYSDYTMEIDNERNWPCLITATERNVTVAEQLLASGLPQSKILPLVAWAERQWMHSNSLASEKWHQYRQLWIDRHQSFVT